MVWQLASIKWEVEINGQIFINNKVYNMNRNPQARHMTSMSVSKQYPHSQKPQQPYTSKLNPTFIPSPMPNAHSTVEKIKNQIRQVDLINRQLLSIVDKIKGMSPLNANQTNHTIIDKIENDMRVALNQLIQNVMEFFKDIDNKLKNVAMMVSSHIGPESRNVTMEGNKNDVHVDAKYNKLAQKIGVLEVSLEETKENQKKLVQVIEGMMERYNVNDQPTIIRESPSLRNHLKRDKRIATSSANLNYEETQRKWNLQSLSVNKQVKERSPTYLKPENWNKSIFQNLYTIEESVVGEGAPSQPLPNHFRLRQIEEEPSEQVYIKRLYAKEAPSFQTEGKKSLRTQNESNRFSTNNQERSTQSNQSTLYDDQQHRYNFMREKLNF